LAAAIILFALGKKSFFKYFEVTPTQSESNAEINRFISKSVISVSETSNHCSLIFEKIFDSKTSIFPNSFNLPSYGRKGLIIETTAAMLASVTHTIGYFCQIAHAAIVPDEAIAQKMSKIRMMMIALRDYSSIKNSSNFF